jgi:hypothetical protein
MSTISRVGFCEKCFKRGSPHNGEYYCVVGDKNIYVKIAKNAKIFNQGFVPHFYLLLKVIGQNVVYKRSCSIHNCGGHVTITEGVDENGQQVEVCTWTFDEFQRGIMTIEQWNALITYKDKSYHL